MSKKNILILIILCVLFVFVVFLGIFSGSSEMGLSKILKALFNPHLANISRDIIWKIRMPRILLAMIVGSGLATCGAVFQGLLRNPLAEPYTLGVSGGAALGVTLAMISSLSALWVPFAAAAGSLLCVIMVYVVASKNKFSNSTLILAGVVLSYLFSSLVMFIFSISRSEDVYNIILWLMGDLSSVTFPVLNSTAIFVIPCILGLFVFANELNILTLGEEKAKYLGVESVQVKKIMFVLASIITGACVAASGMIAFAGLIVPHIMRRFVGSDHKVLLPVSCFAGAIFMIFCDALARIVIRPVELPVGVITGIFGGLFFLGFLLRSKEWKIF